MDLTGLQFLLKLLTKYDGRPAYLTMSFARDFSNASQRNEICNSLGRDGLIDFTREIESLSLLPPGQALLNLEADDTPLSITELKVLEKIGKSSQPLKPTAISSSIAKAAKRNKILQSFVDRGLIEATTKLKRQKAQVWITPKGKQCVQRLFQNFEDIRRSPANNKSVNGKVGCGQVFQAICNLDRELGTNNYLPIFHLRTKLPSLSREELDGVLYELEQQDAIELDTLQETSRYTQEQQSAGISQPVGGPLFFISVSGQS